MSSVKKTAERLIKKYPNRRLYDTQTSSYITLTDVKQLVLDSEPFTVLPGFSILTQDGFTCVTSSFDMGGQAISAGRGAFVCEVASLPIVAGRYLLRIMIGDQLTQQLIPLGGASPSVTIDIEDGSDALSNGQIGMGQLLVVDAHWPRASESGRPAADQLDEPAAARAAS